MVEGYLEGRREQYDLATYQAWQTGRLSNADPKKYPTLKQLLEPAPKAKSKGEKKTPAELLERLEGLKASGVPMRISRLK